MSFSGLLPVKKKVFVLVIFFLPELILQGRKQNKKITETNPKMTYITGSTTLLIQ